MLYRPLSLLTIVLFALSCWAQMPGVADPSNFDKPDGAVAFSTDIAGIVHDMSGNPVNNARVEVIDTGTGRSVGIAYTTATGRFELDGIHSKEGEIVVTFGAAETHSQLTALGDHDLSIRLPINAAGGSNETAVSVTQLNVPGKARRMFEKAEDAFHRAKLDAAFGFVQKALTCYPNYAKALMLRGILNMQKGDNRAAEPDLEKAVELDHTDSMGVVALASLYNNEGQYDRAQQTLDHAMLLNPMPWQANLEMARSQIGKKDYGAAVRSLDRAAQLAPPEVTLVSLYRAQALIGLKDYQGAIAQLETYLSKKPNDGNEAQARTILTKLKAFTATAQK